MSAARPPEGAQRRSPVGVGCLSDTVQAADIARQRVQDAAWHRFTAELERRSARLSAGARRRLAARLERWSGKIPALAPAYSLEDGSRGISAVRSRLKGAGSLVELGARGSTLPDFPDSPEFRSTYPELPQLDYFRDAWSRLGALRELQQSQARVPENAGPLNSNHLMHQSLALMRELSPGYLHQFLAYVDDLSWMEQLQRASLGTSLGKSPSRRMGRAEPRSKS